MGGLEKGQVPDWGFVPRALTQCCPLSRSPLFILRLGLSKLPRPGSNVVSSCLSLLQCWAGSRALAPEVAAPAQGWTQGQDRPQVPRWRGAEHGARVGLREWGGGHLPSVARAPDLSGMMVADGSEGGRGGISGGKSGQQGVTPVECWKAELQGTGCLSLAGAPAATHPGGGVRGPHSLSQGHRWRPRMCPCIGHSRRLAEEGCRWQVPSLSLHICALLLPGGSSPSSRRPAGGAGGGAFSFSFLGLQC